MWLPCEKATHNFHYPLAHRRIVCYSVYMEEMKTCTKCQVSKPLERFSTRPTTKRIVHRGKCKDCVSSESKSKRSEERRKYERERAQAIKNGTWVKRGSEVQTPEDVLASNRKWFINKEYGLSPEDYDLMVESQGNACAICKEVKKLHVDHDHITGEVRELLCHGCNTSLGGFKDDPELLEAAADYIRRHGGKDIR